MFNNDERYWDINLLNKWFAISSIIFLAVAVWTFIDDNDDGCADSTSFVFVFVAVIAFVISFSSTKQSS